MIICDRICEYSITMFENAWQETSNSRALHSCPTVMITSLNDAHSISMETTSSFAKKSCSVESSLLHPHPIAACSLLNITSHEGCISFPTRRSVDRQNRGADHGPRANSAATARNFRELKSGSLTQAPPLSSAATEPLC